MATLLSRVQKGAKLLDKRCLKWHKKVKLKELDMEKSYACVLGQLYGSYCDGLYKLGLCSNPDMQTDAEFKKGKQHGFAVMESDYKTESDWHIHFKHLTSIWTQEIRSRRK